MLIMLFMNPAARRVAAVLFASGLVACAEAGGDAYEARPVTGGTAAAAPATSGAARTIATQRLEAIARGDTDAVLRGYRDDAVLHWVGGPLDGTYAGREGLASVWRRFAMAQAPLRATLGTSVEGANPRGTTVTTPVVFASERGSIRVRHTIVLRDGVVVNETWQVDPALVL